MKKVVINGMVVEYSTKEELADILAATGMVSAVPAVPAVKPKTKTGKSATTYSLNVKDYEPKKDKDGYYVWENKANKKDNELCYKAKRSQYCYAVATGGACNKNPYGSDWAKAGNVVDFSPEGAYYKAKAEFEATFKYITKANRR